MEFQKRLNSFLERVASWLVDRLMGLIQKWLRSVGGKATPLYHHNIEGMLSDCAEMRQQWRRQQLSEPAIFLRTLLLGGQFLIGAVHLTGQRFRRALSLFLWGVEEQWALAEEADALSRVAGYSLRPVVRFLHRITGQVGRNSPKVQIMLNCEGQTTGWGEAAEALFGFEDTEVLSRSAVGTFVPLIETGQRDLDLHLREVCRFPERFRLNVNENCHADGQRFWMLWVNTPLRDQEGNCIGVSSIGIQIQDQDLIQQFARRWNAFQFKQ